MSYKYKRIRVSKTKTVDEHRLIWEQNYGPIPEGGIIHHKDENPRNNDIENLELTYRSSHGKHHYTKVIPKDYEKWLESCTIANRKRLVVECPEGFAYCRECKQTLPKEKFHKNKWRTCGVQYECKECRKRLHIERNCGVSSMVEQESSKL